MSSTCNVSGCHNDNRYKSRQIVMPHVLVLRMHLAKRKDYPMWQSQLDESRAQPKKYTVSNCTRICSNHFSAGRYDSFTCCEPSLYMRKYPEWALSIEALRRVTAVLDDNITSQVLFHCVQSLPNFDKNRALKCLFPKEKSISARNIDQMVLCLDKDVARDFLCRRPALISQGKLLEALAIYKFQIGIEKQKKILVEYSSPSSAIRLAEKGAASASYIPELHNYASSAGSYDEEMCSFKSEIRSLKKQVDSQDIKLANALAENDKLTKQLVKLNSSQQTTGKLCVLKLLHSDELVQLYTGLPNACTFDWLYNEVKDAAASLEYCGVEQDKHVSVNKHKRKKKEIESDDVERLLCTLMKLKLNVSEKYLAFLFGLPDTAVSRILSTWIPFLAKELEGLIHWPDSSDLQMCYPEHFKQWDNVIAIIDCFEVPIEKRPLVDSNNPICSNYKNCSSVKLLLMCTPGGSISYLSPPVRGDMSDIHMFREMKLIEKFKAGDACMADNMLSIEGDLDERGVRLVIPPFCSEDAQCTDNKNIKSKAVTCNRTLAEIVISRVRDYDILNSVIPVTQLDLIGPAATICCALTNLKDPPLLSN